MEIEIMNSTNSPCTTVGTGGVGESGLFSHVDHIVSGPTQKIMVLRNTGSSLCPNTGAGAVLLVNGLPAASGVITAAGSLIQCEAAAGARVTAIVHTIPLNNGIVCIRLGELHYALNECELEKLSAAPAAKSFEASGTTPTRDWYAWNNLMPPRPGVFHLVGEVQVVNLGVDVVLALRTPQGTNPRVLLLDLILVQQPGIWAQIVMWKQARYEKINVAYDRVEIFHDNQTIASIPVDNVV
jgi:hypothetical protein